MGVSSEPLLACVDLVLGYESAILPPVSMAIRPGELWAVVGPNGAGKTTWMRTVLGLLAPLGGRVEKAAGLRAAYIPQQAALDPIYPVRARDMVEMGTLGNGRVFGFASVAERRLCRQALLQVGIPNLEKKALQDLSGGQRQRVLIARAIASGARMFFFDEPTASLDYQAEAAVLDLIDGLRRTAGAAVAIITHDIHVLRAGASGVDRALLLDRERQTVVAGSTAEVCSSESFVHLFGHLSMAEPAPAHGEPSAHPELVEGRTTSGAA